MQTAEAEVIRLKKNDNVVTARRALPAGVLLAAEGVTTLAEIPAGHKVATAPIARGEAVRKYNQIIGFATADIAPGEHVHVQNVEVHSFERDYAFGSEMHPTAYFNNSEQAVFQGIRRPDGKVGTRNYIGILTSVNCSATVARYIAQSFEEARESGLDRVVHQLKRDQRLDEIAAELKEKYHGAVREGAARRARAAVLVSFAG